MSAWQIGIEAADRTQARAITGDPAWKRYVDRLIKYIPGDAVGGYTAAITLFLSTGGTPKPQLGVAILFVGITVALVIIGWLNTSNRQAFTTILPDVLLAVVAFAAWSLTVPGNGWQELSVIKDNPGLAGLFGVVVGILMPGIAGIFKR